MAKKLNIAVLGDLHGHINLATLILKEWGKTTNQKIDFALQVGDFGVWPYPHTRIDKATKRFSENNVEEISFPLFLEDTEISRTLFNPDSEESFKAPFIFIKGNHEDFVYLGELESENIQPLIPVDYYQRFLYLPNGRVGTLNENGIKLKVGSLGGIYRCKAKGGEYSEAEAKKLIVEEFDIFLAHEPFQSWQSEEEGVVEKIIRLSSPSYFFCGHLHIEGQEIIKINRTSSYILNEVNFDKRGKLNKNCIGILEWESREKNRFTFIDGSVTSQFTKENYKFSADII